MVLVVQRNLTLPEQALREPFIPVEARAVRLKRALLVVMALRGERAVQKLQFYLLRLAVVVVTG